MAERMPGTPFDIVARLHGVDVDPLAVATTRAALSLWAGGDVALDTVRVGDHLVDDPSAKRFDLVVGNPPFLSSWRGDAAQPGATGGARRTLGGCGWLCRRCRRLLARRGRCARRRGHRCPGAAGIGAWRSRCPLCSGTAGPVGAAEGVVGRSGRAFAAGVDTVALVCQGATLLRPLMSTAWRWIGRRRLRGHRSWRRLPVSRSCPVRPAAPRWVMSPGLRRSFRDQYYGLTDAVVDDAAGAHPLVTSGVIDPLDDGWGGVRPVSQAVLGAPRFCSTGSTPRSAPGSATDSCPSARCVPDPSDRSDRRCRWSMCRVRRWCRWSPATTLRFGILLRSSPVRSPPLGSSPRQRARRCRQVPSEFRLQRSQRSSGRPAGMGYRCGSGSQRRCRRVRAGHASGPCGR